MKTLLSRALLLSASATLTISISSAAAAASAEEADEQTPAATGSNQSSIPEIIVSARRQAENIQQVPLSVSVVSPTLIENSGSFTALDLVNTVVGLHGAALGNARDSMQFSIRGQSMQVTSFFPTVVPYFAEVPLNAVSTGSFFDMERVEVLKGPQGVRFGRVTNGGAILLEPALPNDEFSGMAEVRVGNYDLRGLKGTINIPIVPGKLAVRGAFDIMRRDGYTKSLSTQSELDDLNYESYRLSALFTPNDRITNLTVFQYQNSNQEGPGVRPVHADDTLVTKIATNPGIIGTLQGIAAGALPAPALAAFAGSGLTADFLPSLADPNFAINAATSIVNRYNEFVDDVNTRGRGFTWGGNQFFGPAGLQFDTSRAYILANRTTIDINDSLTLKNIFGYYKRTARNGGDLDGTPFMLLDVTSGDLPALFGTREQYSNELQLQGQALNDRLDWTVGFYYDKQTTPFVAANNIALFAFLQSGQQRFNSREYAGYVFGEYSFGGSLEGLKVNAGYRYSDDRIKGQTATYVTFPGMPFPQGECLTLPAGPNPEGFLLAPSVCSDQRQSSTVSTYEAGLSYQISPNAMVYAKYSRGYRPGAFNATPITALQAYDPEFTREREVGAKIDWNLPGDMALRTNIAAFWDTLTDSQQLVSIVPPGASNITAVQVNVADATIKGIELETTFVPVRGLTLGANWAYLDAKFKRPSGVTDEFLLNPVNGPCNADAIGSSDVAAEVFCPFGRVPFTPKHQLNLSVDYILPLDESIGSITIGARYNYQTSHTTIADNFRDDFAVIPGYGLLNLSMNWADVMGRPLDLSVFATNVTNKVYATNSIARDYLASVAYQAEIFGPPRMYGASMRVRF